MKGSVAPSARSSAVRTTWAVRSDSSRAMVSTWPRSTDISFSRGFSALSSEGKEKTSQRAADFLGGWLRPGGDSLECSKNNLAGCRGLNVGEGEEIDASDQGKVGLPRF